MVRFMHPTTSGTSGRVHGLVDLAVLPKPIDVALSRLLLDLAQKPDRFRVVQPGHHLPFHDTPFFEPFRGMLADHILFLGHERPDGVEQLPHRQLLCRQRRKPAHPPVSGSTRTSSKNTAPTPRSSSVTC